MSKVQSETAPTYMAGTSLKPQELAILRQAEEILFRRTIRDVTIEDPNTVKAFIKMRLGHLEHEEFHIIHMDNRHRVIEVECAFTGTVDGSSVHPREVVRSCLQLNSCAVIFVHNHPSGVSTPSAADRQLTAQLKDILGVVGVRVLDHFIVGHGDPTSMASLGMV